MSHCHASTFEMSALGGVHTLHRSNSVDFPFASFLLQFQRGLYFPPRALGAVGECQLEARIQQSWCNWRVEIRCTNTNTWAKMRAVLVDRASGHLPWLSSSIHDRLTSDVWTAGNAWSQTFSDWHRASLPFDFEQWVLIDLQLVAKPTVAQSSPSWSAVAESSDDKQFTS